MDTENSDTEKMYFKATSAMATEFCKASERLRKAGSDGYAYGAESPEAQDFLIAVEKLAKRIGESRTVPQNLTRMLEDFGEGLNHAMELAAVADALLSEGKADRVRACGDSVYVASIKIAEGG